MDAEDTKRWFDAEREKMTDAQTPGVLVLAELVRKLTARVKKLENPPVVEHKPTKPLPAKKTPAKKPAAVVEDVELIEEADDEPHTWSSTTGDYEPPVGVWPSPSVTPDSWHPIADEMDNDEPTEDE